MIKGVEQPPSGGCVLKPPVQAGVGHFMPAAFGRLCVETGLRLGDALSGNQPPSGGCVLKLQRP